MSLIFVRLAKAAPSGAQQKLQALQLCKVLIEVFAVIAFGLSLSSEDCAAFFSINSKHD